MPTGALKVFHQQTQDDSDADVTSCQGAKRGANSTTNQQQPATRGGYPRG